MNKDNIISLKKPEPFVNDPITEILRDGARILLTTAVETEIEILISQYKDFKDELGQLRIVRNGHLQEREIQTGIGTVYVKVPRIRDRHHLASKRLRFISSILPHYLCKTKSMEQLILWLYLKGISTGDFNDALAALVNKNAPGVSAPTISR